MKISYNWLRQYLDSNLEPGKISEILTGIGLEVEGAELFQSVRGGLEGVVIGKVISCEKHPNADKLTIARVDPGNGKPLRIVCGAPNVAEGQMVPVAMTGATLYMGDKSLTIKKTKIRGEISEGMICAEDELGLGNSHDGIMVLDDSAVPGTPASEYFKVESDTVFEIGLTPNRIDAASHYGVARDLAAFIGQTQEVKLVRPDTRSFKPDNNDYPIRIRIDDPESCIRYSGLTISEVKVGPSPLWMQNRLRSIGLKPINNVVDITNYVLHETGQPLHAFNADMIKGKEVIAGTLPAGTRFTTLDGEVRELSQEDLMICNSEEGMCIAGVFGGIGSGVDETTTSVFLECACFDPVSVRKTARRHLLNTDASFRFERGTDPSATVYVLKRAALLIKEIAGGKISSDVIDVYPNPVNPVKLNLDLNYVGRLIGESIPAERIKRILELLDFRIIEETKDAILLEIPLYRVDVTRPADVVEEILRIYGYNSVPVPESVHSTISFTEKPDREKYTHAVADMLASLGFNEIISNSLTNSDYYSGMPAFPKEKLVSILNPLSSELDSLRQTLLFGGLEAVSYNSNRQNPDLKLFEFGNVYSFTGHDGNRNKLDNYTENGHLSLFITGAAGQNLWNSKERRTGFFDIKACASQIFMRTGLDPELLTHEESENEIFLYGLQISASNRVLAEYGAVNPDILKQAGIRNEVFFADLRWDQLMNEASRGRIVYSELPRYPEVRRDLAMELDRIIKYNDIREIAFRTEKNLLKRMILFDIYEGDKIAKGKKSYAISFILQDFEGTLKENKIESAMENLASAFEKQAGARIRR